MDNKEKIRLAINQISINNCDGSANEDSIKAVRYLQEVSEAFSLQGVVATLPNIDSNVFKNWLKVNKYAETMNRLVYSKKDWDYDIDVLYRAFTNEIEFGN